MVLDLNRILLFADSNGTLRDRPVRGYFSFIDGVIGGQGEGPLHPDPYESGVIVGGFNPVAVDWAAARLMGFDPTRIPLCANALGQMSSWIHGFDLKNIRVITDNPRLEDILGGKADPPFRFRTSSGWRGTIERYVVRTDEPKSTIATSEIISQ
jgi:uncharacterized protein (DUF362 family)